MRKHLWRNVSRAMGWLAISWILERFLPEPINQPLAAVAGIVMMAFCFLALLGAVHGTMVDTHQRWQEAYPVVKQALGEIAQAWRQRRR